MYLMYVISIYRMLNLGTIVSSGSDRTVLLITE